MELLARGQPDIARARVTKAPFMLAGAGRVVYHATAQECRKQALPAWPSLMGRPCWQEDPKVQPLTNCCGFALKRSWQEWEQK
jgi:hypothetical protein